MQDTISHSSPFKTKLRNKIHLKTLNAILSIRYGLRRNAYAGAQLLATLVGTAFGFVLFIRDATLLACRRLLR
ncbi:hypothetical protein ACLKA7_015649 [Drosophila subpalustris]